MSRIPRRYDAEQVRRFSDTTIAYYDRFARAFWNGTRDHDVNQNYAAFLDAIGSPSGFPGDAIARRAALTAFLQTLRCSTNSQGDVKIFIKATGTPSWHFIDLYPGIYKGVETRPNNFR